MRSVSLLVISGCGDLPEHYVPVPEGMEHCGGYNVLTFQHEISEEQAWHYSGQGACQGWQDSTRLGIVLSGKMPHDSE